MSEFLSSFMSQTALEILTLILTVLVIVLLIVVIICIFRMRALYCRYDRFMRGKDAESLEESFLKLYEDVNELKNENKSLRERIRTISRSLGHAYQKTGMVKYDAFSGMGGQSSFALTLLDELDNGILLNCIHTRETCYLYMKEVVQGECSVTLSQEEEKSLEMAKEEDKHDRH